MMLQTLREATQKPHRALETKLSFLLEQNLTFTTYRNLLVKLFGFYAPVEEMFDILKKKGPFPAPVFEQRKKLPLLEKDLLNLGLAVNELNSLPLCPFLPNMSTPSQILGCMYVLEGATLGGQVILKYVKSSLNLDSTNGAAFFNSYGPAVGPMWKSFIQIIENYISNANPPGVIDPEVIEAVKNTFCSLDDWLFGLN